MKTKKPIIVAGAAVALGISSIAGLGLVGAASSSGDTSLASKIAKKFNLKESDVQAVFDQERADREAEHEAEVSARLQELVDSGKITADQKKLIEDKQKSIHADMKKQLEDLKSWADKNDIEMRYLMGGMHGDGENHRLQNLVDSGKITADQKKLIEDKQAELKAKRDAAKEALDKWASDNGIDEQYLMGGFGPGMRIHYHGGPGMMGDKEGSRQ